MNNFGRLRVYSSGKNVRGTWVARVLLLALAARYLHTPVWAETLAALDEAASEQAFIVENEAAMAKMMSAMVVTPTGDVDRDFVAMMVPHHRGAVEMAIAELRHGRNERLRRLAQEIIVTQGAEILAMRQAIDEAGDESSRSKVMPHHEMTRNADAR